MQSSKTGKYSEGKRSPRQLASRVHGGPGGATEAKDDLDDQLRIEGSAGAIKRVSSGASIGSAMSGYGLGLEEDSDSDWSGVEADNVPSELLRLAVDAIRKDDPTLARATREDIAGLRILAQLGDRGAAMVLNKRSGRRVRRGS